MPGGAPSQIGMTLVGSLWRSATWDVPTWHLRVLEGLRQAEMRRRRWWRRLRRPGGRHLCRAPEASQAARHVSHAVLLVLVLLTLEMRLL